MRFFRLPNAVVALNAQLEVWKALPAVAHVVQIPVVRAPQKYHAPLTTTVSYGQLWSIKNADHAASICKGAGR